MKETTWEPVQVTSIDISRDTPLFPLSQRENRLERKKLFGVLV